MKQITITITALVTNEMYNYDIDGEYDDDKPESITNVTENLDDRAIEIISSSMEVADAKIVATK